MRDAGLSTRAGQDGWGASRTSPTCAHTGLYTDADAAAACITRTSTAVSSPSPGPSCSRTLAGLTSQWRKPRACAWRSAASRWRKKWRACRSGRRICSAYAQPMHRPCAAYEQPPMHCACVPAARAARRAAARVNAHRALVGVGVRVRVRVRVKVRVRVRVVVGVRGFGLG
jgi:hypothetical protein